MELAGHADELQATAAVAAICPETIDVALELVAELDLPFPIVSDPGARFAEQLGLMHDEPFGRGRVPLPTTIVLDAEGRVAWTHVGRGVADRARAKDVLAAVMRLAQ